MNEALLLALLLAAAPPSGSAGASPDVTTALTVRRAVELALSAAPEIAAARATAEEAASGVREAASPRRPQLALNSTPGYSTGLPLSVAGEVPSVIGARLDVSLYDTLGRSEELEAHGRVSAAQGALAGVRAEVARRTASACAKLSSDEARVAGARRALASRESMSRRERALAGEGRRTELDVERAGLEEARARQKLYAAESDRDLDRHELARLVGLPPGALAISEDPAESVPEPEPADTVALAIARDPSLAAMAAQGEALEQSAKLLGRTFRPSVNAEARYAFVPQGFGYDKYYLSFQENVASVGVSVVLPVLTGGREAAQAAGARARLERIQADRRLRQGDLEREARETEARLERARLQSGIARRAVALSEEELAQAQAMAREGRGEADGVDRAQIALSAAEEELARARRDQVEARLLLLALQGSLLSALGAEPEAPPAP